MLALAVPVILQVLNLLELCVTSWSEASVYISSNTGVEVRMSVVVDEFFWTQITPEL